jgi:hypothetical protein
MKPTVTVKRTVSVTLTYCQLRLSLSKGAPRSCIAALAVLGALVAPSFAAAEGPATIRGFVYACSNHVPMPGARVTLHRLDDDTYVHVTADQRGRFARVGLTPGRYLISVQGAAVRYGGRTRTASRLARVDTDDVLDMSIGGDEAQMISNHGAWSDPYHPQPLCDDPLVPPAPQTSDRYVIH